MGLRYELQVTDYAQGYSHMLSDHLPLTPPHVPCFTFRNFRGESDYPNILAVMSEVSPAP